MAKKNIIYYIIKKNKIEKEEKKIFCKKGWKKRSSDMFVIFF